MSIFTIQKDKWGFTIEASGLYQVELDLFGENMSVLPIELRSLLQFFLPKQMTIYPFENNSKYQFVSLCGESIVTKQKIVEHLNKVISQGDPVFVIHLEQNLFSLDIPTKASLILSSIQKKKSMIFEGNLPVIQKRNIYFAVFRSWILPFTFMILTWIQLFQPQLLLQYFPDRILDQQELSQNNLKKLLPIIPLNILEAYDMGSIVSTYELAMESNNLQLMQQTVEQMQNLTQRNLVDPSQMVNIRTEIVKFVNQKSIIQYVWGFFTFINLIWFFSLCGLLISFGPFLMIIFGPYMIKLLSLVFRGIKKIILLIWNNILSPLIFNLHYYGIFEIFAYLISFQFVSEGSRNVIDHDSLSLMICITGIVIFVGSFRYTLFQHGKRLNKIDKDNKFIFTLFQCMIYLTIVPLAINTQSLFLGYISNSILFHLLGFKFYCFGLGICLGWNNENTMKKSQMGAISLISLYFVCRFFQVDKHYLQPFESSICVLGSNIVYLSQLIMASAYCQYNYQKQNFQMIVFILMGIAIGSIFGMEGMRNTAIVYSCLYGLEKHHELTFKVTDNIFAYIFTLSAIVYYLALEANKNPQFIIKMFQI